ncbi:MAG: DUF433 domain-containing protein, partial [Desulfobacterales bacterium]|nr:DUF433 domain-containing protein [Desulfobacterales bacterium]
LAGGEVLGGEAMAGGSLYIPALKLLAVPGDGRRVAGGSLLDRIELNPRVCNGKPVITGTRVPVSVILESDSSCRHRIENRATRGSIVGS